MKEEDLWGLLSSGHVPITVRRTLSSPPPATPRVVAEKVKILMNETHLRERLATIGLLAVLLLLTLCSISATVIVRDTSIQASEAVHMSDLYQQAHYLVGSQSSLMHEYTLQPVAAGRAEFRDTSQKMNAVLQTIAHDGDANDRAFVHTVLAEQTQYVLLTDHFLDFIDAQNLASALAIHQEKIDPLFSSMDTKVGRAATQDHRVATRSLAHVDAIQSLVIICTILGFVLGLLLLFLFWWVVRGYQRQLHAVAQAELLRVEQIALTDPLTGLPNHRTMVDQIDEELVRCQRAQEVCAVLFVDLDHFKHINDTWGHRAGDAVLREASARLQQNIRLEDVVGRYGGEEFVLLLPNTTLQAAHNTAERVRRSIAEVPCYLEPEEGTTHRITIAITASIGVAVSESQETTREALIEAADRAMYAAKQLGRNRVCLAGEEATTMLQTENRSHSLR